MHFVLIYKGTDHTIVITHAIVYKNQVARGRDNYVFSY